MFFQGQNFESEDDSEPSLKFSNDGFNFKRFDRSTKSKLGRRLGRLKTAQNAVAPGSEPSPTSSSSGQVGGELNFSEGVNVKTAIDEVDGSLAQPLASTKSAETPSRPIFQLAKPTILEDVGGRTNPNFCGNDSTFSVKSTPNEINGRTDSSFGNDSTFLTAMDMNIDQMSKIPEKSLAQLSILDSPIDVLAGMSDDDSASFNKLVLKLKQLNSPPKVKVSHEGKENYRPPPSQSAFQTPVRLDRSNDSSFGPRGFKPSSAMHDIFKKPNLSSESPRLLTPLQPHVNGVLRLEHKRELTFLNTITEKSEELSTPSWNSQRAISPTIIFKEPGSRGVDIGEKTQCCCNCHNTVSVSSLGIASSMNMAKQENMITIKGVTYTVLSVLGRGGSSVVYLVMGPDNPDGLAVKCVNLGAVDKVVAEGHLKEIEALDRLQDCSTVIKMFAHEYIVRTKMLYVVMEKGDIDLSKLIKNITKTRKLPVSMILSYWEEMLAAVKDIHDRGIIHSDLKPANFLLVEGRLKLIDFGIASTLNGDMTSVVRDTVAGTFQYMSPEAIRNVKISYKSDVWSLGCILYNLLYGRTPFAHLPNNWSRLQSIGDMTQKVEFPEKADEAPHPILGLAVRMCLEKDPKDRPTVQKLIRLSQVSIPRHHQLAQWNYNYYANEVAKLDV